MDKPLSRTAQATLTVHVVDVDDNIPHFRETHVTMDVLEHSLTGTHILDVRAFDPDMVRRCTFLVNIDNLVKIHTPPICS